MTPTLLGQNSDIIATEQKPAFPALPLLMAWRKPVPGWDVGTKIPRAFEMCNNLESPRRHTSEIRYEGIPREP